MADVRVRDFVYLDIERLKSIVAQVEEGLLEHSTRTRGRSQQAGAELGGSVWGVVKGSSDVKALWEKQDIETRSLHDYLYNRAEEALQEHQLLINLPGDVDENALTNRGLGGLVPDTAFVLVRGRVSINDFSSMRELIDNFNELAAFLARASAMDEEKATSRRAKAEKERKARQQLQLDKGFLKGLSLFLSLFYASRIVIKCVPFPDRPHVRLVGNLDPAFLRDRIDSITYKYGTSPVSPWMIFGQMASVPPREPVDPIPMFGGSGIEPALQGMFDSTREMQQMAQTVTFPEAAITPIAIYREGVE